ncbi:MAG: group II truncated hemoglobin [Pseudomonadota bacterium]
MLTVNLHAYGNGDTSYRAAGGEAGLRALVAEFYRRMGSDARFAEIHGMHPNADVSEERLWMFLSGWLGGPRIYQATHGSINIPAVHGHLPIGQSAHDQWLMCMSEAIDLQDFDPAFKDYLKRQLAVPAGVILARCTPG